MRETCARALAAALLTGAIATVVGMAAHLGTPGTSGGPIAAQQSLPEHTVRLTVQPAPRRRATARLVSGYTTAVTPRPEVATRTLVVIHGHSARRPPHRELAATTPAPQPAVSATSTVPPPASPAPAPVQTTQQPLPEQDDQGDDHRHGRGRGHGRGGQDD